MRAEDLRIEEWPKREPHEFHLRQRPGVSVTHIPSGITYVCAEHRHQYENKAQALRELEERLVGHQ